MYSVRLPICYFFSKARLATFIQLFPYFIAASATVVNAQQIGTYQGVDPNGSEIVPLKVYPNSTKARLEFLQQLSNNVGNQTFEEVPAGSNSKDGPIRLVFSKPGQPTLLGDLSGANGAVLSVPQGTAFKGNYGTSPTQFWSITTGDAGNFTIRFDRPLAAIGLNGIDIGDFDGVFDISTFKDGVLVKKYQVQLAQGDSASGSVLFFGIVESIDNQFDTIEFDTTDTGSIADIFSFDDIVAAYIEQVSNQFAIIYGSSLQPYAANPQLLADSLLKVQSSLLDTAGKCDRYGWILDDVDASTPNFRYLHGNITNDWKLCIFGEGGNEWAKVNKSDQYGGYNIDSPFFRGGLEVRIGSDFIAGAAYAYSSPSLYDFSFNGATGSIDNSMSIGSLYLSYQPRSNWEFTVIGSMGKATSNGSRSFDYTEDLFVSANSKWRSDVYGFGLELGYEHYFKPKQIRYSPVLRPAISYQWVSIDSPSFSEEGSGQLADINSYQTNANVLGLSLGYEHPIKLDTDGLALFIPKLTLNYKYNFSGNSQSLYTVSAVDQQTGMSYSSSAGLLGNSSFRASLFGDLNLGDSFTFYAGLSYFLFGSGSGFAAEGGIRVRM